jgi:antitoxin MazE
MPVAGKIVRIGNSRGLRIPKAILEQCGLVDEVELTVTDGKLVVAAKPHPRAGWEEEYKRMMEFGDDAPLLNENDLTEFDRTEWVWE